MKIFFLVSRVPFPINKGDKLRAFHQLRLLSKYHEIVLFALNDPSDIPPIEDTLLKLCKKLIIQPISKLGLLKNLIGGLFKSIPFQVSFFYSKKIKIRINKEIEKEKPDLIYCQLIRVAEYVRDIKGIPKIIDYVDALSKGLERRKSKNPILNFLLFKELKRVRKYEAKIFCEFDRKIIITEQDRNFLSMPNFNEIDIIPNGVDIEYFKPIAVDKDFDLLFTGNLSYPPNIEAVKYLVHEILPIVLKKKPDIRVLVVGASPGRNLLKYQSQTVTVKGWVDDIRECYASSKIFVAPMNQGTGLQNKLLEAMAMEIPCITSPLAQKGLKAPLNSILVANSPGDYAMLIMELLQNKEESKKIAIAGRKFVSKEYSWENISEKLNYIFNNSLLKIE